MVVSDEEKIKHLYAALAIAVSWAGTAERQAAVEIPWLLLAENVLRLVEDDYVKHP